MKYVSFSETAKIYDCGSNPKILRHAVWHTEFEQFCFRLKQFERLLGDASIDSFWKPIIFKLRRYRFEMCASPLPFDHTTVFSLPLLVQVNKIVDQCRYVYPGYAVHMEKLSICLKTLVDSGTNPILNVLTDLFRKIGMKGAALLLKEPRLIPATEIIINSAIIGNSIDCINIQQYRSHKFYKAVVVIGPSRLYPDFIFSAPRAAETHIVNYHWIRDKWEHRPVFANFNNYSGNNDSAKQGFDSKFGLSEPGVSLDVTYIDCDEILPVIDWDEISSVISKKHFQDSNDTGYDTVEAKLFLLEGLNAVFLDGNAKVLVLDLDEDEGDDDIDEARVKRMPAVAVQEGMYLLLRTIGGGEYIVPVADQILGSNAQKARECQKHWKMLLREQVYYRGTQAVANALRVLGSVKANEINVRNWMGERSIRPANYNDFEAIMKLIKIEKDTSEYWKLAEVIDEAHQKAGFHIRKLLLKQVLSSDLNVLEKTGRMDFVLEEADGGSLTAFRITGISPEGYTVPIAKIGHPFERDDAGYG